MTTSPSSNASSRRPSAWLSSISSHGRDTAASPLDEGVCAEAPTAPARDDLRARRPARHRRSQSPTNAGARPRSGRTPAGRPLRQCDATREPDSPRFSAIRLSSEGSLFLPLAPAADGRGLVVRRTPATGFCAAYIATVTRAARPARPHRCSVSRTRRLSGRHGRSRHDAAQRAHLTSMWARRRLSGARAGASVDDEQFGPAETPTRRKAP
jgi:hypothetical protein